MWHGGGLSGVTYETKPDGKPGWLNYFLRQGWDVYISDAMERGRSGWTTQTARILLARSGSEIGLARRRAGTSYVAVSSRF